MLQDEFSGWVSRMGEQLARHRPRNVEKWAYYDGEQSLKNIGLAVPETMVNVEVVLGWPEIVVDALDERLDWHGWSSSSQDVSVLNRVFRENRLGHEFDKAKLDALVTGVGFFEVSAGGDGEPDVIVNAVSSMDATYVWDEREGRVKAGFVSKVGADGELLYTLYFPDSTVTATVVDGHFEIDEVVHNRGVAGLIPVVNRNRAGEVRGRSEITRPIRYYTDHGVRTLLGMEYNREIYTTPQRWFKNVYADQFGFDTENDTPAQAAAKGVRVAMNRTVIMEPQFDDDGAALPEPSTGQYQSAPPTPYIEQLKMLSQLCSAQSGVPSNYFGFHTENPPSADAIRALESRLVKKAERRQSLFDSALLSLASVIQLIAVGSLPDGFVSGVDVRWRDASTPTRSASVDAAVKLAGSIVPAESSVLLEMAGFTPDQVERVELERARSVTRELVDRLRQQNVDAQDAELADRLANEVGGG